MQEHRTSLSSKQKYTQLQRYEATRLNPNTPAQRKIKQET